MLILEQKTDRGTRYTLDAALFTSRVKAAKAAKGSYLEFVTASGSAGAAANNTLAVLAKLKGLLSSVEIEIFEEGIDWRDQKRELVVGWSVQQILTIYAPHKKGHVREDLYDPPSRIGVLSLGYVTRGGRGMACLYLFAVPSGSSTSLVLVG